MIDIIQVVVLSIVQGITEFLPVSSSAHLVLVPQLFDWQDQGLAFDVFVHLGTLFSVLFFFQEDLKKIFFSIVTTLKTKELNEYSFLGFAVILGTIPVGLAGLLFKDFIEVYLRSPNVIVFTTIFFGLLLWYASYKNKLAEQRTLSWGTVCFVGAMQSLALIPGTSRSGITMTAGLLSGMKPEDAAKYSFLLSIPVIILASILMSLKVFTTGGIGVHCFIGFFCSLISGFFCIKFFMSMLHKIGIMPFVIYRILLGIFLIKFMLI